MLAITTHNGTSLIDPVSFKNASSSFPVSGSLECSTNVWSSNNSQLYLANSTSIKRYTPSECLVEELYDGSETVTCLAMKDKDSTLFFAAGNKVWSLDCRCSPGEILSSLEPHKKQATMITLSNDSTLLASVSASAVFVHNMTLSSHTQLRGLPDRKPVTCCMFHQHSRTRLLLAVGRDILVYDSTRPSGPLKTIRIPGGGDIVSVAASPFSKTLVAAVTSTGDVALVDLDKDNGILKNVNVKMSLTCCAFTAEGAAVYLGTTNGQLLILDLRSLEKEPKSFTIGDGSAPIKEINVREKSKSQPSDGSQRVKAKSSSTVGIKSPSQRSASSARVAFSPVRVTAASKIRGGGGTTPNKKPFSPARTPLSETKNLGLGAQLVPSHSPLSRRLKPLRLQRSKVQEENRETRVRLSSATSREPDDIRKRIQSQDLGLGSAPESISGHLAAMRIRSSTHLDGGEGDRQQTRARRVISESVARVPVVRKPRSISTGSSQGRVSSSKAVNETAARVQKQQVRQSTTPDDGDEHLDLSSPELPCEPVTPISFGKKGVKVSLASATGSGVLGLTSAEVAKWAKGESKKGKGKEKAVEVKKTRFAEGPVDSDESEDVCDPGDHADERQEEQELSLQVSPRRPKAPPAWLQSPHRPSTANLNVNAAAHDFLRNIVHDVMYDFQRETKAEMMGLHLDLVRMGRGWKQELREIMEEWKGEIQELKAENKRLKDENERLRRGY